MSDTTLDLSRRGREGGPSAPRLMLCLVWSVHAPDRVGERLDPPADGSTVILGRSPPPGHQPALCRVRPGARTPRPPLDDPFLSRSQLAVGRIDDRLRVENLGRCPMWVGGRRVRDAVLSEGDVVVLERRAALICLRRADSLPALARPPRFAFGHADEHGIVGESSGAWLVRHQLDQIARRDEHHVLVFGESGTGKELVARAIHAASSRARRPLVARNAATMPASLVDAELFGHARNYPNAGMPERPGLFGEADRGVLFLDELGELPESLQVHLLRVLDAGEYQRLGETRVRRTDVRVIGATNRSPGELRHDLLARFALQLSLPALRDRIEDVPLILRHLLRAVAQEHPDLRARFFDEAGEPRVSVDLIAALVSSSHPLNVRGLHRTLWQALLHSPDDHLALTDQVRATLLEDAPADEAREPEFTPPSEVSAEQLRQALRASGGKQAEAWRALGLKNRYVLRRLLKKYRQQGEVFDAEG